MASNVDSLVRLLVVAFVLLLLAPLLMMLFLMPVMGVGWWMFGPMGPNGSPNGFGGVGPVWVLGFWVAGLALAVGIGYLGYRAVSESRTDPAIRELREAYARGDLSQEEYEERREALRR
ncbi:MULTISPECIES: SHOCT domain-containing protein [Halorussus]|uniref:SHOCT domain-containing protein n=1 Tax=Halorussus TaxID=1070314 RepID=UPI0020A07E40|nr:SHOCT domain-containing protein [Halorussus vallis]USZ77853.1 SHOCT domain-containing protein [Halorussus vallis]